MIRETAYKDFSEGEIGNKEVLAQVNTTDATVTTLETITPPENCRGFLLVTLMALIDTDATYGLVGRKLIHYKVSAGTASIISSNDIVADDLEGFSTATWAVDASSGDLRIRVTGETSLDVDWYALYDNNYIETSIP